MEEIKKILEEEIQDELDELGGLDLGSETYKTSVEGLVKLMDRKIEMDKLEIEMLDKDENRKNENRWKELEMKEEKKSRLVRDCITAAGIVIPSVITVWGTLKTFKFEEEGTITTNIGRGFINKLLPKK